MTTPGTGARPIVQLSRLIPASRDRVFRAWTDSADVERWWPRPEGVELPHVHFDLRVGGSYRIVMRVGSEGPIYPLTGTFIEVVPPTRLVYSFRWEKALPLLGGDFTGETQVTVEFRDVGDSTEVVLTHEGLPTDEVSAFHNSGWEDSLTRLAVFLEGGSDPVAEDE